MCAYDADIITHTIFWRVHFVKHNIGGIMFVV